MLIVASIDHSRIQDMAFSLQVRNICMFANAIIDMNICSNLMLRDAIFIMNKL